MGMAMRGNAIAAMRTLLRLFVDLPAAMRARSGIDGVCVGGNVVIVGTFAFVEFFIVVRHIALICNGISFCIFSF